MADNIRVKFEADASSYSKQLKELTQQNKTLKSEVDKVKSSTDQNTTSQEKAAKVAEAIKKQVKGQEEYVKALKAEYEKLSKAEGDNSSELMKQEEKINKAETALNKMNAELEEAQKEADGYGDEVSDAAEQTDEMTAAAKLLASAKLAEVFGKISDEVTKVAKSAYSAARELDDGYDTIIKKTGATGDEFKALKKTADNVFGSLPADMADVGTAIGEINTRFGLTGEALEETSELFLKFANITDTDVNSAIGTTSRLLKTYGGDVKQANVVLGYFAKQAQLTGVDATKLMNALDQNGAVLRSMGLDLQQSTRLLALFEQNGVDSTGAMTGLRKAIVNGAKDGKSFQQTISEASTAIKSAATDTEALQIATELFGTKGAVVMADGIRSGRISLDELTESMETYGSVVGDTFEATLDPWDKAKVAMNNLKAAGADLVNEALGAVAPLMEKLVDGARDLVKWFGSLPKGVKVAAAALGGIAAVSPKILALISTFKTFSAAKTISELGKIGSNAGAAAESTSKLGSSLGSFGKYAGLVGGVTIAMAALNDAANKAALKNNAMYQGAIKTVEAYRQLGTEAMTVADAQARLNEIAKQYGTTSDAIRANAGNVKSLLNMPEWMTKFANSPAILAYNTAGTEIAALIDIIDNGNDVIDEASDGLIEMGDASVDMSENVEDASEEVVESFEDIYNAAKTDLQKSTSLIDAWADASGQSIEDVIKTLEQNAKDWANWTSNVQTVTKSLPYKTDPNFRAVADQIIAMEGRGATALAQLAAEVNKDGSKIVTDLKNAASGAQGAKTSYVNTMSQLQAEATVKMKQAAAGVQTGVNEMVTALNNGSSRVRDRANAVRDAVGAAKPDNNAMKSAMDVYMTTYENAIKNGVPKVKAQAMAAKAAAEQMKVTNAYTWGADAVAALAKGMEDKRWQVRKVANILAQDVKDRLGHSTPKLGPLHGDDQWGYHMVDNLIKGMTGSERALKTAALDMASIMAKPTISLADMASPVSNSLTYGDIVVNVSGANVQNEDLLARKISDQIFRQVKAQRGAFA